MSGAGSGLFLLAALLAGPDAALSGVLNDFELYLPAFDTLYMSDEPSCCGALVFSISSALARVYTPLMRRLSVSDVGFILPADLCFRFPTSLFSFDMQKNIQ